MRLIDADAFEADLNENLLPKLIERYGRDEALSGLHFSFRDCICNIQTQPTIKPQRNTGTWLPADTHGWEHQCSECGFSLTFGGDPKTIGYDFCPGCGAQMNGGEPDEN